MATYEELHEAITDYIEQARKSARVTRSLRHWRCVVFIEAVDLGQRFAVKIQNSQVTMQDTSCDQPDLIIRGSSEDLTNIFWCDANPTSAYMQGAIKTQGPSEHMLRLDAVTLLLFLELNKT